jgi:hypothetical protein
MIVGDASEIPGAPAMQGCYQVLRRANSTKPGEHDGGAIRYIRDGVIEAGQDF